MIVCDCSTVAVNISNPENVDLSEYNAYNYLEISYTHYDGIPYKKKKFTYFIE
jgi:hypothetical protein